jgi:hypothetical protein
MPAPSPGFRSQLRDLTQRRTGASFDVLDDFQKSQWTTRIYLDSIVRVLNPAIVPEDPEDFASCFADGPSDSAVDFLYRQDGHVLIVQAKYRGHGRIESEHEFDHFCNVLTRLHPIAGRGFRVSERVRELASEINWATDTFDLHYITLGRANDNIRAREANGQSEVQFADALDDRVEISFLDEGNLNEKLREAESAGEQIQDPVELRLVVSGDSEPWIKYRGPDDHLAYIGQLQAPQLRNLYNRYKYRLFAQNIRNYVGDTSTNKGIITTALTEPENFFFFNNGIAAIATHIEARPDQGVLRCTNFSIVNGAQTVRSLAKAHLHSPAQVAAATVLIRVSCVSLRHNEREEAFLDKITRFNNTQNAVKLSDFRSNDPVQRGLARKFSQLHRAGKQYWYKNKRSAERDARKIPIAMEEFAKTIYAMRFGPADVYGGTAYLFDTAPDSGYVKVFGVNDTLPATVSDEHFQRLAGTFLLGERIREMLAEEKANLLDEATEQDAALIRHALERRWFVYFTVAESLRQKYRREHLILDEEIPRLADPRWLDQEGPISQALRGHVRLAMEVLIKLYRAAERQPDFAHRNWFRSAATVRDIQAEIQYSGTALAGLALLRQDTGQHRP